MRKQTIFETATIVILACGIAGCDPSSFALIMCGLVGCGPGGGNCTSDPDNPLEGTWRERSTVTCDDDVEMDAGAIQEIIFDCDGTFDVTWQPFETYVDYWGDYTFDPDTNGLTLSIRGGNYVPETVALEGTVEIQNDGSARLDGIYFGAARFEPDAAPTCGHVLE